jgi:hypothetical protein
MTFPEFDSNVVIENPYYGVQHVNQYLCATPDSAAHLAGLLVDLKPQVVIGPVFGTAAGSPFTPGTTTFLQFPSGMRQLAGVYQMNWVRNPTPDGLALANCKVQIAGDEYYYTQTQNQ